MNSLRRDSSTLALVVCAAAITVLFLGAAVLAARGDLSPAPIAPTLEVGPLFWTELHLEISAL